MKRAYVVTALCLVCTAFAAPARAAAHTCELVAPDVVAVDGMTDEWRASKTVQAGDKSDDASFSVRCAYDGERLYLVVSVRDDYVYRGKRPSPKTDDTLLLELAVAGGATAKATIAVFPGKDQIAPAHLWGGKKLPADVMVEDTRQRQGWSVELAIPFGRIPGLGASTPGVSARIEYRDADFGARTEGRVSWDGTLQLQASAELFGSFLEATKLGRNDIRLDQVANIDDQAGPERVVAGGAIVGVIAEGFTYMMLPVAAAKDVLEVKLVDLRGDGTMSIVVLIRQHGNGGSRDLLTVWGMAGNGLERILAVEVRKELGGRVIANRWSLVSKGSRGPAGAKRGKRGADLVVEVSDADVTGWDEDSYGEVLAPDVQQILTPWTEKRAVVYRFEGNTAVGPEPATGGKATGKASVRRRP